MVGGARVGKLIVLVCFLLGAYALILWMAGGVQSPKVTHPAPLYITQIEPEAGSSKSLTVMTWNIAWAYGIGSEGVGSAKPKRHFEESLQKMGAVLAAHKPDLVLLQEVDFDCTRSHHVDQSEVLAKAAGLPYVSKAVSWQANWVPFPYWPPEDHFGQMLSGGAILSRYPLEDVRVETVEKPEDLPWWKRLFYLFRYHQQAIVQSPLGKLMVMNIHADAFNPENRIAHARRIADRLNQDLLPESVVGGDLNSVLPEAEMRRDYPDEPETSHIDDPTVGFLREVPGLVDTVEGKTYTDNEAAFFTFPSDEPNRKLDYLFHGAGLELDSVKVLRTSAGQLSDHLPILARFRPVGSN